MANVYPCYEPFLQAATLMMEHQPTKPISPLPTPLRAKLKLASLPPEIVKTDQPTPEETAKSEAAITEIYNQGFLILNSFKSSLFDKKNRAQLADLLDNYDESETFGLGLAYSLGALQHTNGYPYMLNDEDLAQHLGNIHALQFRDETFIQAAIRSGYDGLGSDSILCSILQTPAAKLSNTEEAQRSFYAGAGFALLLCEQVAVNYELELEDRAAKAHTDELARNASRRRSAIGSRAQRAPQNIGSFCLQRTKED